MGDYELEEIDELLLFGNLSLDEDAHGWISDHIDYFVSQSRGNETVKEVTLIPYLYASTKIPDGFWDKFGQAVGNLQALERLIYATPEDFYRTAAIAAAANDDEVVLIPDSEIVASILSHVRQQITLELEVASPGNSVWHAEEARSFARAIHGHPTIWGFVDGGGMFPYEVSDALYSALATLPALELIKISNLALHSTRPEDESALANPESLTELLRVPSLLSVCFDNFYFTGALCQATANGLMEGTAIIQLDFAKCMCSSEESAAIVGNSLSRNTSVTCINVMPWCQGTIYNALAAALPSNSTLQYLTLGRGKSPQRSSLGPAIDAPFSPVISALGQNSGLKNLIVDVPYSIDESLCTAMQNGLGMNETLVSLELNDVFLCDDNAELWCKALSFLRTNKALKSLVLNVHDDVTEACLSAFRSDIAAMLQENTSLKGLSIQNSSSIFTKAEDYIAFVTLLQKNKTLTSLELGYGMLHWTDGEFGHRMLHLTDGEDKDMAKSLQKNYGLESLPNIFNWPGDVLTILRLNAAGRRYLTEAGSSISKGVEVLSAVRSNINCVFLHLLENPNLCDRSAVEAASDSTDYDGSTSPVNPIGKRAHGRAKTEGKESRRRLT
jgi:hypothetical protein